MRVFMMVMLLQLQIKERTWVELPRDQQPFIA